MKESKAESNKVIAEFMGYNTIIIEPGKEYRHNLCSLSQGSFEREIYEKGRDEEFGCLDYFEYPKYDNDWSWLMPVVEKIEGMGFEFGINGKAAWIGEDETKNWLFHGWDADTKLEATYTAVVKFIEWYNSHPKSNEQR